MEESELEIVRQAKRGEQQAFTRLFERYRGPVLSFLFGMVGRGDLAEDLAQETVSRAFLLLPNLRDETKFSTWLFGIARNVAREKLRHPSQRMNHEGIEKAEASGLSDPGPGPEMNAMKRQLHQAINRGFAAMDEDRRVALALRVLAGKRYQEIAEITGWSLARVKIEIHRARLEMREKMRPFWAT